MDQQGKLVGEGDLGAQTEQVMRNLGAALAAGGATFANVVKITTYVVDYKPEMRAVVSKARSPFFAGREPPASTLVGVSALALPGWLIEIEAIAVLD
jgi:enamine deaminase RidA (YjgF/YER057c/UK114 family)